MSKKSNITENYFRILALFTSGYNKEYYIREVNKILNISPDTARLILEDLENKQVLESKTRGKIKTYKIKKSSIATEYLVLTEQYKRIKFFEKHFAISKIITKIKPFINGLALIFGSYAKGKQKQDSDLDILVIGRYDQKQINNISEAYGIEINLKNYPFKIFQNNLTKDILIKEVLDNHIVIKGAEEFIQLISND